MGDCGLWLVECWFEILYLRRGDLVEGEDEERKLREKDALYRDCWRV